ncbi:NGG1 interacting factor 3-like protein [Dendrothele bispora CBS 962.96]|uniref:NGG1 interacting factor 3-like protein n=1 Tax=Dendrothele bispora (strain CBS 962.96) TaxID=1314807 RepID=A0A4S8KUS6_DENBC|nr:NGG1 interacting factor 3-like protein [Dendrothele bispora CBS 962.96]
MALFLKAVCRTMERIAPLRLAEKWDNVGLLIESPVPRTTNRVMLTIDLTPEVLAESLKAEASVIVSYHPPIFQALKSLTLSNPLQASLLRCAAEGISVYSPHTSLDSVWGGVNDWLGEGLMEHKDDGEIQALKGIKQSPSGDDEGGEGRLVVLKTPVSIDILAGRIKRHLGLSHLQASYTAGALSRLAPVSTIAICAGSGGSMLLGSVADVYLTGEMGHHEVLAAVAAGKHVILCGHTNTERGYLPTLASKLQEELQRHELDSDFKDVQVLISKSDVHPLHIV